MKDLRPQFYYWPTRISVTDGMAVRTRFLQIGVALVNVAILVLVFTSIWPFPSGEFKVDLPNANDVQWSYNPNGTVNVVAPFTIHNGWIYDVDDLVIQYSVTNVSGHLLKQDTISLGTLPAERVTSSQILFSFNLIEFYNNGGLGMVFQDDTLHLDVMVSCMYTMKLISFEASYVADVPWDALIRSYGVSNWTVTGSLVSVSYWIETARILAPLGTVTASVTVLDSSRNAIYGPLVQSIVLGANYTGTLQFTPTIPSALPSYVVVEMLGYHFEMGVP